MNLMISVDSGQRNYTRNNVGVEGGKALESGEYNDGNVQFEFEADDKIVEASWD